MRIEAKGGVLRSRGNITRRDTQRDTMAVISYRASVGLNSIYKGPLVTWDIINYAKLFQVTVLMPVRHLMVTHRDSIYAFAMV